MHQTERDDSPWVRRLHASPVAKRLVCFPHAGGSASYFRPLFADLASSAEVLAIQYPGRQDRRSEKCLGSIHELAAAIADELRQWLDRPVALFGHSMGAIIAYEVATLLERDGDIAPLGLFVSGRKPPSLPFHSRLHEEGDERIIAEIIRLDGTHAHLFEDHDFLDMVLPSLRGDYKAIGEYRWERTPPLTCPIWAFVSEDDPQVSPDEAALWRAHTQGAFEMWRFPGGHFFLNDAPRRLLQIIAARLSDDAAGAIKKENAV